MAPISISKFPTKNISVAKIQKSTKRSKRSRRRRLCLTIQKIQKIFSRSQLKYNATLVLIVGLLPEFRQKWEGGRNVQILASVAWLGQVAGATLFTTDGQFWTNFIIYRSPPSSPRRDSICETNLINKKIKDLIEWKKMKNLPKKI